MQSTMQDSNELVKHGRVVFNIVAINIAIMMATESIFSAISPYIWIGEVFVQSSVYVSFYAASSACFYIANTFFVCLLLYVVYYFGLEQVDQDGSQADSQRHRSVS